jgi:hypothetical protein
MIIVCKIVKYGTKMEIKNLTTTTNFTVLTFDSLNRLKQILQNF